MTSRRASAAFACATLVLLAAGCGGGERVVQSREVAPFDRIVVGGGLDVEIAPGPAAVRVRAGEDVLDRVTTRSAGGELRLEVRDRGVVIGPDPLGDARARVTVPALSALVIDGSGEAVLRGVDEDAIELEIRGTGRITASGTVDRLTARIRGAGDADLADLRAREATVLVQGAGDADIAVRERLDVTVQGAADVTYAGDPEVSSEIQGAGDIQRADP